MKLNQYFFLKQKKHHLSSNVSKKNIFFLNISLLSYFYRWWAGTLNTRRPTHKAVYSPFVVYKRFGLFFNQFNNNKTNIYQLFFYKI